MRGFSLHPSRWLRCSSYNQLIAATLRPHRCTQFATPNQAYSSSGTPANNEAISTKNHAAYVKSALAAGPLPYEKGWAWQHVLLNRRLNYMRTQQKDNEIISQKSIEENGAFQGAHDNNDWILMFEHEPVYTLGRGASEEHLTFLNNESDIVKAEENRKRLGRKYRGEDASRLNIDRSSKHGTIMSVEEEVSQLSKKCTNTSFPPVFAPNGSPIYRIERGGEVTYHGPGQLVVYPLLNLKHAAYEQDLHWYLRQIEEVIIHTLSELGISSNRDTINTGVWVGQNKIAAVGVSSSRWITTHGLAINVHPNLLHFDNDIITPCGIEGRGVTSIAELLGLSDMDCPTVEEVGDVALKGFGKVFGVELVHHDPIR